MPRYATIDIGTNSVLLLVAERDEAGRFQPVLERANITRLGRGVDRTGRLDPEAMADTLAVVEGYVREARSLGVEELAVLATSAARDASNGAQFLELARQRCDVVIDIISGGLEAELAFRAAQADFGTQATPLVVIDIGGGSTEFIYGSGAQGVSWHRSYDVGAVRLTERFVRSEPMSPEERQRLRAYVQAQFASLPAPPRSSRVIGIAGTVTTLFTIEHRIHPYDAQQVHGGTLSQEQVRALADRLSSMPVAQRRSLVGLDPKRADVISAGAHILLAALEQLAASQCTVSDRGVRWGLMSQRFGSSRR